MTIAIEVEDLRKIYRTSSGEAVRALDGVSFQVSPGHIYGLLGPNGAGKSTLVKILSTITPPTSGRASVLGFDVARQPLATRQQLAVVLQQTATENLLTVRDNLLIFAYLHGVKSQAAQQRLKVVAAEFELGERLRDTVQELSLGTKRRIQVAKIFMLDAPVIILDEATTGMDPIMKRRVMDRLRAEARNGRTILLTTQVLSEAEELCENIMILDQGRSMASGTLRELRKLSTHTFRVNLSFAEGKISFNVLLAVIGSVLAIVLGVVAMDAPIRWDLLPLTAVIVMAATAGWFFLFSVFAIKLARMDACVTKLVRHKEGGYPLEVRNYLGSDKSAIGNGNWQSTLDNWQC